MTESMPALPGVGADVRMCPSSSRTICCGLLQAQVTGLCRSQMQVEVIKISKRNFPGSTRVMWFLRIGTGCKQPCGTLPISHISESPDKANFCMTETKFRKEVGGRTALESPYHLLL